jgi:hypothetical protein
VLPRYRCDREFETHRVRGGPSLVFVMCYVGSDLWDGLITQSEDPYWVGVSNCVRYILITNFCALIIIYS